MARKKNTKISQPHSMVTRSQKNGKKNQSPSDRTQTKPSKVVLERSKPLDEKTSQSIDSPHRRVTRSQKSDVKSENIPSDRLAQTIAKPLKVVLKRSVSHDKKHESKTPADHDQRLARIGNWEIGQIVWSKMRGFPNWPAKIVGFPDEANRVEIVFYGDRTYAKMFKNSLTAFEQGAKEFQLSSRILLNKAFKEALIEMKQRLHEKYK